MSNTIGLTYANDKYTDGAGAQLQRIYGIYALSRFLGLPYIHSPLKRIGYEGLEALQRNSSSAGCELKYNDLFTLESDVHLPEDAVIHEIELVDTQVIEQIQIAMNGNKFNLFRIFNPFPIADKHPEIYNCVKYISPFTKKQIPFFRIAIHVRRGELYVIDSHRMLPNSYYISTTLSIIRILEKLSVKYECELYTEVPSKQFVVTPGHHGINHRIPDDILVHPQMNALEDFNEIPNLKKHINGDPIEALRGMATADILIMSRSSFSYVAAILNMYGIIIYHPFWHSPIPGWIIATENNITCATELIKGILFAKARLSQ
jgi:hypothetical protein